MASTGTILIRTLILLIALYLIICVLVFLFQEKMIFFPEKLGKNYRFSFNQPFEEIYITTGDDTRLHGLLFTSDSAKGLIFYLHGNAGSADSWGSVAKRYTDSNYDVFVLDYPGYGKSEGSIKSQSQLFNAVQTAYDEMKKRYREETIVVLGYSIGSGPAAYLASANHPKLLILQAPYYSLVDMMKRHYPILPTFLLKYKFRTHDYIKNCKMPIIIFHGDQDEVIYYGSSQKLKKLLKPSDTLITLKGQGHNGITDHADYIEAIHKILQ